MVLQPTAASTGPFPSALPARRLTAPAVSKQCLLVYSAFALAILRCAWYGWSWMVWMGLAAALLAMEVIHQFFFKIDGHESKVVNCYEFYNKVLSWPDLCPTSPYLTEGKWDDDPLKDFDAAHRDKLDWLLDNAECGPGVRILEVGCGNGTLLEGVKRRSGHEFGITLAPDQVAVCRGKGLRVEQLNFWDLNASSWAGSFDAIVFNGVIEHLHATDSGVPQDVLYTKLFEQCSMLLDPRSSIRKVVITCIHLRRDFRYGLTDFLHLYLLDRAYGGGYPRSPESLIQSSSERFRLVLCRDATRDYYLTSLEWTRRIRRLVAEKSKPALLKTIARVSLLKDPYFLHRVAHLVCNTWVWQFDSTRRTPTPTQHLWLVLKSREAGR